MVLRSPAITLRLDGESFEGETRVGVVTAGGNATLLGLIVADGVDEGGSFSASEAWGDWEGEMAACRAEGAGEVPLPGVEGGGAALAGGDEGTGSGTGDC